MRTIYKFVFLLLAICILQVANAQNDSIKTKASSYLPEKGNFAIGVDATPLFDFVGNMFNGNVNNNFNMSSPLIYAKYYLTDMSALRVVLGVNTATDNQLFYVQDDAARLANPLSNAQVTDMRTDKTNGYYLSLGLQKFIGEKRLRGFYGGQFFTQYNKNKSEYAYGNPMTTLNPTPSSNFGYIAGERKLSEVTLSNFMVGAGGIAGFEYFVAPRLCIGGEVSLNVVYTQKLQTYKKSEKIVSDKTETVDKAVSPGGHELNFQTSSFTPNTFQHVGLYIMLHF
jgi:hypothetical protein